MKTNRVSVGAGIVVAASIMVTLWGVVAVRATPELAKGLSAGTSKLDRAPVVTPSAELAEKVTELATFARSNPAAAVAQLRQARVGVGQTKTNIFAFKNDEGRPCVVVPGWIGFCEPNEGSSTPGLDWSIGGGDPQTPSKFIAVYSDDVAKVRLLVDGVDVPVSMSNNVAYAEFPADAAHAEFSAVRGDGRSNARGINLQG